MSREHSAPVAQIDLDRLERCAKKGAHVSRDEFLQLIALARAGQQAGDAADDDDLLALPAQPEELRARWKCEDCDGRGHDGEAHWQGHFQPPEPALCGACQGSGWVEAAALLPEQVLEAQRKARDYQKKVDWKIIDRRDAEIAALRAQLASAQQDAAPWSKEPPTEQGEYWHWNGEEDTAPYIYHILWSGTAKKCFVSIGQYGITEASFCDEFGGWWKRISQPAIPVGAARTQQTNTTATGK